MYSIFFFFFQAEDGIRDLYVTGVQTCALPIFVWLRRFRAGLSTVIPTSVKYCRGLFEQGVTNISTSFRWSRLTPAPIRLTRSEERRVGKECRYRSSPYH